MNVRNNNAGSVSEDCILTSGFREISRKEYKELGVNGTTLCSYIKDDKLVLIGGYWNWYLKDKTGKLLWEGWWNNNEEFGKTVWEIENQLNKI